MQLFCSVLHPCDPTLSPRNSQTLLNRSHSDFCKYHLPCVVSEGAMLRKSRRCSPISSRLDRRTGGTSLLPRGPSALQELSYLAAVHSDALYLHRYDLSCLMAKGLIGSGGKQGSASKPPHSTSAAPSKARRATPFSLPLSHSLRSSSSNSNTQHVTQERRPNAHPRYEEVVGRGGHADQACAQHARHSLLVAAPDAGWSAQDLSWVSSAA